MKNRPLLLCLSLLAFSGPVAASVVFPGALYESFADHEVVALDLQSSNLGLGFHFGNATKLATGGGKVYWQDGADIYVSAPDLSGASLFHSNGMATTDIAVDAGFGALYESFAGHELVAVSLADNNLALGVYQGNASNVTVGGGKVYWQDGADIYVANSDLSGVDLFHSNGIAPSDIAVDAAAGVLYESFAGHELVAISLANSSTALGFYFGNATNIAVGDDLVYWQDGVDIYSANWNLSGVSLYHSNGIATSDIAFMGPITIPDPTVPEPGTLFLSASALGLFGLRMCLRRFSRR